MQCWFAHRGVHNLRDLLQSPGRIPRVRRTRPRREAQRRGLRGVALRTTPLATDARSRLRRTK
eukprot:413174-Prymnesium_polylepis.1